MKRVWFALAVLSVIAAPAAGQTFQAGMTGAQENPAVATAASGSAVLTLNAAQDTLTYAITITGLDLDGLQTPADPNDDVTNLHIHNAPAGSNGAIVFGMITPGHDLDDLVINGAAGTVTGAWEESDANGNAALSSMLTALANGDLYLNAHTPVNPGGEIRGQILLTPLEVPTTSPLGLVVLGVLLSGAAIFLLWRRVV